MNITSFFSLIIALASFTPSQAGSTNRHTTGSQSPDSQIAKLQATNPQATNPQATNPQATSSQRTGSQSLGSHTTGSSNANTLRQPRSWSTSRRSGFDKSSRADSRAGREELPRDPVSVNIKGEGPLSIRVRNTGRVKRFKDYHVPEGEPFDKTWTDPKRLRVDTRVEGPGSASMQSYGRKVFGKVGGEPLPAKLSCIGPCATKRNGIGTTWEVQDDQGFAVSSPFLPDGDGSSKGLITTVRGRSSHGHAGVQGAIYPNNEPMSRPRNIYAAVSNSPSHSPAQSPGPIAHSKSPWYLTGEPPRQ